MPEGITFIGGLLGYGPQLKLLTLPDSLSRSYINKEGLSPDLVIRAHVGTYAEQIAKENDITFEAL